jgi:PD-(D/E)XK nuclease superfamily protein
MEDQDPKTQRVIGCAIEVHRTLGPGLLESAWKRAHPAARSATADLHAHGSCTKGLLINFNVKRLVDGIKRFRR